MAEQLYKGYGQKVTIKFKKSSPFGRKQSTLHNVTEIHKNFTSVIPQKRTAFESDIHGTGVVHATNYISRIIKTKESKKHKRWIKQIFRHYIIADYEINWQNHDNYRQ